MQGICAKFRMKGKTVIYLPPIKLIDLVHSLGFWSSIAFRLRCGLLLGFYKFDLKLTGELKCDSTGTICQLDDADILLIQRFAA